MTMLDFKKLSGEIRDAAQRGTAQEWREERVFEKDRSESRAEAEKSRAESIQLWEDQHYEYTGSDTAIPHNPNRVADYGDRLSLSFVGWVFVGIVLVLVLMGASILVGLWKG
jgi:hypothetical protein